ncbi:MAG: phosphate uptake regulator PhoU [Candidatus Nanohaloarchaea archaeon]|nr:phosphate uptake regulator PhoU [Candidatus Nanohaloarchaea archaeon]
MEKPESRKVQKVGESTLSVSLPKYWTEEVDLEAGDEVIFEKNKDGSLTLKNSRETEEGNPKCIIDFDSCRSQGLLSRAIVGAYILGYETVEISSDSKISMEQVNQIQRTMRRLNGMTILAQEPEKVVLHNFMDVEGSSVYIIIRKLYRTVLHMLDSAVYGLVQGKPDLIEEVGEMENDVDILYWLILRQLLSAIEDEKIQERIGIESSPHIVGNRTTVKSLEGMADCIEDMGEHVKFLLENDVQLSRKGKESLSEITELVHKQIGKSVESLIEQDVGKANEVLESAEIEDIISEFLNSLKDVDISQESVIRLNKIAWRLERVIYYSKGIAEICINRKMEESSEISEIEVGESSTSSTSST